MTDDALDRLNAKLAQRLRDETQFVPSTTRVSGRLVIRPCLINPRTTLVEVDGLVDAVARIEDELSVPVEVS